MHIWFAIFVSPGAFSLLMSASQMQSGLVEEGLLEGIVTWRGAEFCRLKANCPATQQAETPSHFQSWSPFPSLLPRVVLEEMA